MGGNKVIESILWNTGKSTTNPSVAFRMEVLPMNDRCIRAVKILIPALIVVVFSGCASKRINDVLADPARYANKNVKLTGDVVESYSIAGRGFYRIEDTTGRLWIFSDKGVPRKGARVSVKGKIKDGFDLGALLGGVIKIPDPVKERIETGLLMIESSHKAAH